jgi:hypothetical protein
MKKQSPVGATQTRFHSDTYGRSSPFQRGEGERTKESPFREQLKCRMQGGKERHAMKARLHRTPVMIVNRKILKHQKVVYLLVSKRPIKYENGRSRIAYIGTTSKGIHRVATSVAYRAADTLSGRGLSSLEVYFVTCAAQRKVRTWLLLEHALLARFRTYFFEPPKCNAQGKYARWTPILDRHFTQPGIDKILTTFDP